MKMSVNEIITLMEKGWSKEEIIALCNTSTTSTTKPPMGTSKKAPSKSKGTNSKAPSTFDRELYETIAKEMGCFYRGKVCATVENGKIIRHREDNRKLIYAEMEKRQSK